MLADSQPSQSGDEGRIAEPYMIDGARSVLKPRTVSYHHLVCSSNAESIGTKRVAAP
jgi:hypothetical protein